MTDKIKPIDLDPRNLQPEPGTLRAPMVYAWARACAEFFYNSVEELEPVACPTQIEILAAARLFWRTVLLDAQHHIESCKNPECGVDEFAVEGAHALADQIADLVQDQAGMRFLDDEGDFFFAADVPEA